jgi:hypothetical protein
MFLVTVIPLGLELVFTTLTTIKAYQNSRGIKNASIPPLVCVMHCIKSVLNNFTDERSDS